MLALILVIAVLLAIDYYAYQPVRILLRKRSAVLRKVVRVIYWTIPVIPVITMIAYQYVNDFDSARILRYVALTFFSINYIPKLFISLFLLINDTIGVTRWTIKRVLMKKERRKSLGKPITRSEFVSKVALVSATAPLALLGFGIVRGAHDYEIRRRRVVLPNLPRAFDGIKIAQLSDIHTGSFFNRVAVQGGVDMLLAEKPDVVFFTGDLVNDATSEVRDYMDIFSKVKAPLGVFSTTGNHDYGDYTQWASAEAKKKNFQDLIEAHRLMGYRLLMNENVPLTVDGESIGIFGIENWGAGRFQKYGDLQKTLKGGEEYPVKLLLSHDPSHWDAQVREKTSIDLMFAGHTHGFQFGVEIGDFKWSPSQYIYKQWADLYEDKGQFLYVNRGFGFLGYPGRIGITPEITILELKRS